MKTRKVPGDPALAGKQVQFETITVGVMQRSPTAGIHKVTVDKDGNFETDAPPGLYQVHIIGELTPTRLAQYVVGGWPSSD